MVKIEVLVNQDGLRAQDETAVAARSPGKAGIKLGVFA